MKPGQVRKLKFWALRNGVGMNGGVVFDVDTEVTYLCRVIRIKEGLKWQIIKNKHQYDEQLMQYDQECLDNYEIYEVKILHEAFKKYVYPTGRGKNLKSYFLPF